jgi:hypothetical protein
MTLVSEPAIDDQTCAQCGFSWAPRSRAEFAQRMSSSVESFVDVFEKAGPDVGRRPSGDRWSILEYGGHVRDVILDVPVGTPIYRDERIDIGFYAPDAASDVLVELQVATYLYLKTVAALPENFEERKLIYSTRTPLEVTISGAMSNALHECLHHLGDVNENLRLLDTSTH